jgi:hypothetical protein
MTKRQKGVLKTLTIKYLHKNIFPQHECRGSKDTFFPQMMKTIVSDLAENQFKKLE